MRSPAAAIAWELSSRHRWGLGALLAYLAGLAGFRLLLFASGRTFVHASEESFAFTIIVPLSAAFMYLLAVFSFGLSGDLAGRRSIYPSRMFTLPVETAALAGWPMLYGTLSVVLVWLAARALGTWPASFDMPWLWPASLGAAILAWTQALLWMPYALRGVRVIVTVVLMTMINVVVLLALHFRAPEPVMLAFLLPHLPLAYVTACFAVARARRGDVPDWRRLFVWREPWPGETSRRLRPFSSAGSAQAWLEWRQHGRSLPGLVAIVLPFELALLFAFRTTPLLVVETLLGVLLTPPFLAVFVAATVATPRSDARELPGLMPFLATRPLRSAALIAAKLEVALWSTVVTWLLVLAATAIAVLGSGTATIVSSVTGEVVAALGTLRAVGLGLVVLTALVATTWKQLVQSLCIGLTGRPWLVKGSLWAALVLLTLAVPLLRELVRSPAALSAAWRALPALLLALVGAKTAASVWLVLRLHRERLLEPRPFVLAAASWSCAVTALYLILSWLVPALIVPSYVLALVAVLAVPLVRIGAAPLALDWNRHR